MSVADLSVEYAQYTTFTTIDDWATQYVREAITRHWGVISTMLIALAHKQEVSSNDVQRLTDLIVADVEVKNPLLALTIVSIFLNIIRLIKSAKDEPDTDETPDTVKRRPIRDALRKLLGRA